MSAERRSCLARCGRHLRSDNRNPLGLCGYCQAAGKRPVDQPSTTFVATGIDPATKERVDAEFGISVVRCSECPLLDVVMERCRHPGLDHDRDVVRAFERPEWCPLLLVPLRVEAATL